MLLSTILVIGCSQAPGTDESSLPPEGSQASAPGTGGGTDMGSGGSGGSSGSVQIHTGGAGGLAPVTGTENLGGGGGGVQQAAKDKARETAAGGGASSLDQMGDE